MRKVVGLAGGNVAVDLLVWSGDPDGVNAELVKIALLNLFGYARKVTAVECTGSGVPA